jgi:hypothetical protein
MNKNLIKSELRVNCKWIRSEFKFKYKLTKSELKLN